jgi:hypothetical protein
MLSETARKKLAMVLGQLICRAIEDGRKIPYVLEPDEVIDILVRDPAKFTQLVNQEEDGQTQFSTGTLTAQLDAITGLGQLEILDRYDMSFGESNGSEENLKSAVDEIHQLTRLFAVYIGNTVSLFEKEFDTFASKFHQSLHGTGYSLGRVNLQTEDLNGIEESANRYLDSGKYIQAFLVDRLLSMHVVTRELVSVPQGYSVSAKMIEGVWRKGGDRKSVV